MFVMVYCIGVIQYYVTYMALYYVTYFRSNCRYQMYKNIVNIKFDC
jgi:hypothetical protein